MPRINYNPSIRPSQEQKIPGQRIDIAAAGAQGQALAGIAATAGQLAGNVGDMVLERKHEESRADMAALRSKIEHARAMTQEQVSKIPVQDGVNYRQQADAIMRANYGEIQKWMEEPGNVRNAGSIRGTKEAFSQVHKQALEEAKQNIELYGETYEFIKSKDRYNREIETGIQSGNPEAIRNGVQGRVRIGEISSDEAETLVEQNIQQMNKKLDADDMSRAELAMHAGDLKAYDNLIDGLRVPTKAKKAEMKATGKSSFSYNEANLTLAKVETAEGVASLISDMESGKLGKHASVNQRAALGVSAAGKLKGIKRNQMNNAARIMNSAQKGQYNAEVFDQMAADDTASGLPRGMVEDLRAQAIAASEAYAKELNIKATVTLAKESDKYKEAKSELTVAFIQPNKFNAESDLNKIKSGGFHPVIEAELMQDYLKAANIANLGTDEFDPGLWGFERDVSDEEKEVLEGYISEWSSLIDAVGADASLYDHFNDGMKDLRKAFKKGDSVDEEYNRLVRPIRDRIMRERLLRK